MVLSRAKGFLGGSDGKESACNVGDPGSIPGLGRSPGERNGKPLQYSCLENTMDGGAWQAIVHGVTKIRTQLSNFTFFLHELMMSTFLTVEYTDYWQDISVKYLYMFCMCIQNHMPQPTETQPCLQVLVVRMIKTLATGTSSTHCVNALNKFSPQFFYKLKSSGNGSLWQRIFS